MMSGRYGLVLREVGRLLGGGTVAGLGTGSLLGRFVEARDPSAFEALVTRHGPMVLGTCRRMLDDPHDVDDAFQATFLVLARKAGSIQDPDRLGPWLHGVARKVAARSRALSARNRARERLGDEPTAAESPDLLEGSEVRQALDEELTRLPEKYRAPLVLCYLEGLTHDEAAQQLRWPVGTVRSRLAGGRDRLRARLTRRGLAPSSAAIPALLPHASIPQALLSTTVKVATAAGTPSAHVAALAKGALIAMMWNKLKLISAVGLMAGLTVGGVGVAAQQQGGSDPVGAKAAEAPITKEPPGPPRGKLAIQKLRLDEYQIETEMARVRAEARAVENHIKELRAEQKNALLPLEKSSQELDSRYGELSDQLKKRKTDAASTAIDDRIKRLEAELEAARAETQSLKQKLDVPTLAVAPPPLAANPTRPDAVAKPSDQPPSVDPPAPQPIVHTLNIGGSRGGTPPLFAVISAERDRVTIIDSGTKERSTFKMPKAAKYIIPIIGNSLISLDIKGPEITRTALYDLQDKRWYEYDLKEPATAVRTVTGTAMMSSGLEPTGIAIDAATTTRVAVFDRTQKRWIPQDLREPAKVQLSPYTARNTVSYRVGRFLYTYNVTAKKWSTLEANRDITAPNFEFGNDLSMIQDGDLIHLYDEKTGEWTHINTKDDK